MIKMTQIVLVLTLGCSNTFIDLSEDADIEEQDTQADEADAGEAEADATEDTPDEVEAEIEAEIEEDAGTDEAEPEDSIEPEDVTEVEEIEADAGTTICEDFETGHCPLCTGCPISEWEYMVDGSHSGDMACNYGDGQSYLYLAGGLTTAPVTIDVWFQVVAGTSPGSWNIGPMQFSLPSDLYVNLGSPPLIPVDWVWTMGWTHLTVAYTPGAWVHEPNTRMVHIEVTFEAVPLPPMTIAGDAELSTPVDYRPDRFTFRGVRIDDLCVTM